jgi:hypothetical protein
MNKKRYIHVEFADGYVAQVKLDDEGVVLDVFVDDHVVASTWRTYDEIGVTLVPEGEYVVQKLMNEDIQQAVGDDTIEYTHGELKNLAEHLTEYTYNGDEWCTAINEYHESKRTNKTS